MSKLPQPATIIGGPVSPYVRKVLAVCALKGVPYRLDPIIPFFGDDKFSELNPLRRVPVYSDDQVSISDSTVICEYLEERFPEPHLLPSGTANRAQARWIEEFADTRLGHVAIWRLFYESVIGPLVFQTKRDKDKIAGIVTEELPDVMATLERLAPAEQFLFGGDVSTADISVAVFFANMRWARVEPDRDRWPKTLAWIDRTTATPALASITTVADKLMQVMPDQHRRVLADMAIGLTETTVAAASPRRSVRA
jgi:glutathione S-transferase